MSSPIDILRARLGELERAAVAIVKEGRADEAPSLADRIGAYEEAIERLIAAGYDAPVSQTARGNVHWTGAHNTTLREMWLAGATCREIALAVGHSPNSVAQQRRRLGLDARVPSRAMNAARSREIRALKRVPA